MENNSITTPLILGIIVLGGICVLFFLWSKFRSQNQGDADQFISESRPTPIPTPRNEIFESVDEKLKKLKELLASNLISPQDYERMKAEILEGTFRPTSTATSTLQSTGLSENATAQIISFLKANQKINAIKVYRQETNVGLKEAKDAVEELERRMFR
jgi:ribosomal protein L7/L12